MVQEKADNVANVLIDLAISGIKAFGLILFIVIILLALQSFSGVALGVISDFTNFLLSLLP